MTRSTLHAPLVLMSTPRKRGSVKREHRKAIRVSLAIFLACVAGYSIDFESAAYPEFKQASAKWAAITASTVASPLLGSAARTGAERILGTLLGGAMGLVLHQTMVSFHLSNAVDGFIKAAACSALAAGAILVGEKWLKLNYSAKLFQITLLLVTFAAESSDETEHLYFISRVAGIGAGVVLMLVLSVVLLPKSATNEALKELRDALEDLVMLTDELFGVEEATEDATVTVTLLKDRGNHGIANRYFVLAENLLEMQENVQISRSERVIAKRPSLVLLPRLFPSKQPVLPSQELTAMADDVRQVAGSLGFLHRTLITNHEWESQSLDSCIGVLRDVLLDIFEAFPSRRLEDDAGPSRRLDTLTELVAAYDQSGTNPVIRAALGYVAHDVQELWGSSNVVVPMLPTFAA